MNRIMACLALAGISPLASAVIIDFSDLELGTENGTATAKSYSKSGQTLNITTGDGIMGHIGSGQFAGVWFSQNVTSDGTYKFDFNGAGATYFEFSVDAQSGNGGTPVEIMQDFALVGGSGVTFTAVGNPAVNITGATLSTLNIASIEGIDNGEWTVTISSLTPFTEVSFRHTQNPNQNGSVIQHVVADVLVPAPGALALLGLSGLVAARRRRA